MKQQPYKIKLPGFSAREDTGLGDMVKKATHYIGLKPCAGCLKRAEKLNRWIVFSARR